MGRSPHHPMEDRQTDAMDANLWPGDDVHQDASHDFRVGRAALQRMRFAIFGLGSSVRYWWRDMKLTKPDSNICTSNNLAKDLHDVVASLIALYPGSSSLKAHHLGDEASQ
jgi:hypothetical protein